MVKVLVLLVGIRSRSLRKWTRLQPGEHRTHITPGFRTCCGRHLHEQIQGESLTSADHRQQPDAPWRGTFPQEAIAFVVWIFPNGEHAAQVDGATDGAERPGKEMERVDIGVQGCAKVCQLLWGQAWVLLSGPFVPGTFAYRANVEQVSAAIQCRHGTLLEQMAQASFVIVEVAERAMTVEKERVIWYHVVSPFAPRWEKTKWAAHPARCAALSLLIWSDCSVCV